MKLTLKQRMLGLIGLLMSFYTLCWFVFANHARNYMAEAIAALNSSNNIKLEYGNIRLGGYPFNISLSITKPHLTIQPLLAQSSQLQKAVLNPSMESRYVVDSTYPITLQSDAFARKYRIYLPPECILQSNLDNQSLTARVALTNAEITLLFRHSSSDDRLVKYFGQFANSTFNWRDLKMFSWHSDSLELISDSDLARIYQMGETRIGARSHKTLHNGIRLEGKYSSKDGQFGSGFPVYMAAINDRQLGKIIEKQWPATRLAFAVTSLWPYTHDIERSFDFSLKTAADDVWELQIQRYQAKDSLTSRSMELKLTYHAEQAKLGVLGYYAIHYMPEWYLASTRWDRYLGVSIDGYTHQSNDGKKPYFDYYIPRLHEYDYIMSKFNFEIRKTPNQKSADAILQPLTVSLQTNRYLIQAEGGLFSLNAPYLSGRTNIKFSGYPAMIDDLSHYLHRMEKGSMISEDDSVNSGELLFAFKKMVDSSDSHNATLSLYDKAGKGIMVGKYRLEDILR